MTSPSIPPDQHILILEGVALVQMVTVRSPETAQLIVVELQALAEDVRVVVVVWVVVLILQAIVRTLEALLIQVLLLIQVVPLIQVVLLIAEEAEAALVVQVEHSEEVVQVVAAEVAMLVVVDNTNRILDII